MPKTSNGEPYVASLTIYGGKKLSKRELRRIRKWLTDMAKFLEESGDNLSSRFRARLMA